MQKESLAMYHVHMATVNGMIDMYEQLLANYQYLPSICEYVHENHEHFSVTYIGMANLAYTYGNVPKKLNESRAIVTWLMVDAPYVMTMNYKGILSPRLFCVRGDDLLELCSKGKPAGHLDTETHASAFDGYALLTTREGELEPDAYIYPELLAEINTFSGRRREIVLHMLKRLEELRVTLNTHLSRGEAA